MTGNITRLFSVAQGYIRKQINYLKIPIFGKLPKNKHPTYAHSLKMQLPLLRQQFLHRLLVHLIRHTTIYRANRRTLRLFMKPLALCTFIWNDIVGIYTNRSIPLGSVDDRTIQQGKRSFYAGAVRDSPLHAPFIYCVIGAFGFTCPTIDTFFCYFNSHFFKKFSSEKSYLCTFMPRATNLCPSGDTNIAWIL